MARQATQKEVADAMKKKKAKVAHRKYKKEKEVARCVKAGERKSDVESKLESEDPTDVDDMVFFEEEESQEVIVTSVERRDPTATSAGDEQEAAWRAVVPASRKHATSVDAIGELEVEWTWSPRPLLASLVLSLPAADVVEQTGRSEERTSTSASLGVVLVRDSWLKDALPTTDMAEHAWQFEEWTSTSASCDS